MHIKRISIDMHGSPLKPMDMLGYPLCYTHPAPRFSLKYIFGEIMYGGHITDDFDRLLCGTYLEKYMCNELFEGKTYLAVTLTLTHNAASGPVLRLLFLGCADHLEWSGSVRPKNE